MLAEAAKGVASAMDYLNELRRKSEQKLQDKIRDLQDRLQVASERIDELEATLQATTLRGRKRMNGGGEREL